MNAIERLMREHDIILKTLDALDRWAEGGSLSDLQRFVDLIVGFADKRHHGKEEEILFVVMERHGFSRQTGPIGVMLAEHDEGRSYVRAMGDIAASGDESRRADAVVAARSFISLLRNHIGKENNVLYPMAQQHISADAMAEVDARCARFDEEGATVAAGLESLASELQAAYLKN